MKFGLASLLVFLTIAIPALAQTPPDVAKAVEKEFGHKLLTLRGQYRDENLRFAVDGAVFGSAETAFAVSDARFDLQHAELKGNTLILKGDVPTTYLDEKTSEVSYHIGWISRTIEMDLAEPTFNSVMITFWKVFYRSAEVVPGACTPEEFRQQRQAAEARNSGATSSSGQKQEPDPLAFGERGNQPEKAECRANGDKIVTHVVRRSGGIKAPHPVYTPNPDYPSKDEKSSGTVVLQCVVDPKGHASSIIVTRPLGHGFDEAAVRAVHGWKFDPATREGEPTPVTVTVEVSFRRY